MKCTICGNGLNNSLFEAQEMMYGMNEKFSYLLCSECGCLQITEIPENIQNYYDGQYYFYEQTESKPNPLKQKISNLRNNYALSGRSQIGKWLYSLFPTQAFEFLRPLQLKPESKIVDVGCGSGALLKLLATAGMKNLLGADPFIPNELNSKDGVKVLKIPITDVYGAHDLIMFNHSFEHIPNQLETLKHVASILKPNGHCVIRIPTVSSYAWKHYGVHWVQLDAPRHFFLHSITSLEKLAHDADMRVDKVVYDSTAFQFWGSEQYLKDIPLRSDHSYAVNPASSPFSDDDIAGFTQRAHELNQLHQGDQAIFYLRPKA